MSKYTNPGWKGRLSFGLYIAFDKEFWEGGGLAVISASTRNLGMSNTTLAVAFEALC